MQMKNMTKTFPMESYTYSSFHVVSFNNYGSDISTIIIIN